MLPQRLHEPHSESVDHLLGNILELQINQNRLQKHSRIYQIGSQIGTWGSVRGSREYLGGPLGGSGGHLGPKIIWRPQKWKFCPSFGGHLGGKNQSNIKLKLILNLIFFYVFMDRILTPFGAQLAPFWHPKPIQNEAKLVLKSFWVGAWFWEIFSEGN